MALGGFFFGMAAAVKPTAAPLGLALLLMIAVVLRRRGSRMFPYMAYGVLGAAVPAALFIGFLLHYQALDAFLYLTRTVTAYYAGLSRMSLIGLVRECMPRPMRILVPFGLALALINPDRRNWERWALALGSAFGFLSYVVQGKGFYYQRYPLIAITLLWFAIEFAAALRRRGWSRALGGIGAGIGIFVLVPLFAARSRTIFFSNIFTQTLETDLRTMGVDQLQRNVECLDMVDGCMNALYHLGIVQHDGRTGDNLLFASDPSLTVVEQDRLLFWDSIAAHPPDVFVLSDEKFPDAASFDKLDRWPQFRQYLADHYDLRSEHRFPIDVAYRIYVRKGSFAGPPTLSP
jgi:hypothetical protein